RRASGVIFRSRRSCTALTADVGLVADQHTDSTIAPGLRVSEVAALDLGRGHARHDQRITNDDDTTWVGAVEPDLARRICVHVSRDLACLAAIGILNLVAVGTERVVPVRTPSTIACQWALDTGGADRA